MTTALPAGTPVTPTQVTINLLRHARPVTPAAASLEWAKSETAYTRLMGLLNSNPSK